MYRARSAYETLGPLELAKLKAQMALSALVQEQINMQYRSSPLQENEGAIVRVGYEDEYVCNPRSLQQQNQPLWQIVQQLALPVSSPVP